MYSNKIDELVDSSNEEAVISRRQSRIATSPQLSSTGRNKVAGHSELEEGATRRNEVSKYFEKREEIEGVNKNMSEVSFLD